MKLPLIQQGAADRPAMQDVRSPLREANARAAIFQKAGAIITDEINKYQEREKTRQVQEGILGVQQRMIEWEQQHGATQEYDLSDPVVQSDPNLQDAIQKMGVTNMNQTIPAYRIQPELQAKAWDDAIAEFSERISDKEARDKFIFDQQTSRNGQYLRSSAQASKQQIEYVRKQTDTAVDNALKDMDYGGARLAVLSSDLTTDEKTQKMKDITRAQQVDSFSGVLKHKNLEAMELALGDLLNEESKNSSELTEQEEQVFANQLRTAINAEKNKRVGTAKGSISLMKDDAKVMTREMSSGGTPDPVQYANTLAIMREADPVIARNMEVAQVANPIIKQISQSSIQEMTSALSSARQPHGSVAEIKLAEMIDKATQKMLSDIQSDTVGFMVRNDVMEVPPIDTSNPQAFAQTLAQRVGVYDEAIAKYGYSSGYLSSEEVQVFSDAFNRVEDPARKMEMFAGVFRALGDRAPRFYEQLKNSGVGGADMIAGQLAADGSTKDALAIVEGSRLTSSDIGKELITSGTRDFIKSRIIKDFGNAFQGNHTQRELMQEAVTSVYAKLSFDSNDYGSANGDRINKAIQIATGGLLDFEGSVIQAPEANMSASKFTDWMKDISPVVYEGMDVFQTPAEVKDRINSGEWKLRGVGRGTYNVIDERGMRIRDKRNGMAFTIKYDAHAPVEYDTPTEADLERIRQGKQAEARALKNPLYPLMRDLGLTGD